MARHLECPGDPLDVVQRDVPRLALDMSDERPMQARFKSQRLLRPPPGVPKGDHVQREDLARRVRRVRLSA